MIKFGSLANWAMSHPKTIVGGALAAGAYAAHPLRGSGLGGIAQESLLGTPTALGDVVRGSITNELRKMFYRPSEQRGLTYLQSTYRAGPAMGGANGPYTGPSGNVVFGLYNLRAR